MRTVAACVAGMLLLCAIGASSLAAAPAATASAQPQKVDELLKLLADPQVQGWLERQRADQPAAAPSQSGDMASNSMSHYFEERAELIRGHIAALATALPRLPAEFAYAFGMFRSDMMDQGLPRIALLLALFAALGFGLEWLFRAATKGLRAHLDQHPVETVRDRVHLVAGRLALAAGLVVAFAIGSIGAFLALDWPSLLREVVLGYLAAFIVIRFAAVFGHFLLAPRMERFRVLPMETRAARFWHRRVTLFVGWFAIGFVSIGILRTLGVSLPSRQLIAYMLGLGLLAIALEAVWRRPAIIRGPAETATASPLARRFGRTGSNAVFSTAIVLLWVLWVLRAMAGFWLLAVAIVLPLAIGITRRAVEHLLRPPGSGLAIEGGPSVLTVFLERGIRALLIAGAAAVLAWGWDVDMESLTAQDTLFTRLVHGALSAIVIILIADLVWHSAKAAIDNKLAAAGDPGHPNTAEARRGARLRTLLPIFRNILFVIIIAVAAMMALAAMGVEIGPLIAGAGVVGVAVGFGAQGFVRDVIAGMFYLLDDAFRVGEYIQSGNYKGTVEGFSIRSVRLRHHRGPVYTVPFSLLGAVQNQSRDWVIDKLMVGITYDSDIEKARKLIKQIGLELAQDAEFAPLILEPLKMQGVEQFGDFAVQIRMKMMTLPGEQFVIRRKAYALIKKAFDANGIKFAFPTVQVAGGDAEPGAAIAAAADRSLDITHPPTAVAAE